MLVSFLSYTSRAVFFSMWEVSLTHPMLASFLYGEFLLHIPCCLDFYEGVCLQYPVPVSFFNFFIESFSYTSRASFFFSFFFFFFFFFFFKSGGVCLTHAALASFLSREFLLNIPC